MSSISTAYDTILSTLVALFPTKTRIRNAIIVTDNPVTFLRDGWGLRVDDQSLTPSEFCKFETIRVFTLVLTREIVRTDSQYTQIDEANKLLLEDVYTAQKDFYNIDRLGIPHDISRIELAGTSGVAEVTSGKNNFKSIEVYFNVHIRETL